MRATELLNRRPRLVAIAAILAACAYAAFHLRQGWIPHDEGQLGQAAERTLAGELPHRDFDDMYTGGLSYLHALAFRLFGVDSHSMRSMTWFFFVPTAAALYYLASRLLPPLPAAALTLLGAALSLPVYSAPMPSWYNLFFAIGGAAALARYVETNRARWLVAAGFCGGLSILFKITGLYFIASGLLWLTYREQLLSEQDPPERPGWYSWLARCGLAALACLGLAFLRAGRVEMNALHFTAPLAGLAGLLFYREQRWLHGASNVRWRRFVGMAAPFGLSAAIPLAALVGYYASQHAIGDLYEGLFVLPRMRVESGVFPLPGFEAFLLALPLAALAAVGMRPAAAPRRSLESVIIALLIFLFLISGTQIGFNLSFFALRNSLPLLIAVAAWMLLDQQRLPMTDVQRQFLFLATAVAALGGLVQYPHAYGIYFFYAAPLAALLAAYIVALQPSPPRRAWMGLLAFYLAFAVVRLNGADPHRNVGWAPARPVESLGLERCNLTIPADEADVYRRLTSFIQKRSSPGSFIFAGPDSPEVYFLSQRRNPSGVMYEFFRPDWLASREPLLSMLKEHDVAVAVVNCRPGFSPPLSAERIDDLRRFFPHEETIAQRPPGVGGTIDRFRVFWRELP